MRTGYAASGVPRPPALHLRALECCNAHTLFPGMPNLELLGAALLAALAWLWLDSLRARDAAIAAAREANRRLTTPPAPSA